jgi:hypothetical protein
MDRAVENDCGWTIEWRGELRAKDIWAACGGPGWYEVLSELCKRICINSTKLQIHPTP